jgi:hypothetical protein
MVVPEDHVGADDPTLKMIEVGQLVFDVSVDPVGQREMPGSDMDMHPGIIRKVFRTVDSLSAKKCHENRWLAMPPAT